MIDRFSKYFYDENYNAVLFISMIPAGNGDKTLLKVVRRSVKKPSYDIMLPYAIDPMNGDNATLLYYKDGEYAYLLFVTGPSNETILIVDINNITYTTSVFNNASGISIDRIIIYPKPKNDRKAKDIIEIKTTGLFDPKSYEDYFCNFSVEGFDNFDSIFRSNRYPINNSDGICTGADLDITQIKFDKPEVYMHKDRNMKMDDVRYKSTIKDAKDLNCKVSVFRSKIGNISMSNIRVFQDLNDLSKHFSTNVAQMSVDSNKNIKVFTTNTGCRYLVFTTGMIENCLNIVNIDRECGIQYNFVNAHSLNVKDVFWNDEDKRLKIVCSIMCPCIDIDQVVFEINCASADEILTQDNFIFRSEYVHDLFFSNINFNHYEMPIILPGNRPDNSDKGIRLKHIKSRPVKLKRKEETTMPTKKNETKAAESTKKEDPTPREIISQYAEVYDNMTEDAIRGNGVFGLLSPEHRLSIAAYLDQIVEILEIYIGK